MTTDGWVTEFPGSITVCDAEGVIVAMNERAAKSYEAEGGKRLIGKSLLDCHPEPARSKFVAILEAQRTNAYTIEKRGVKKLIYQAPWYEGGSFRGLVELSLEIPRTMPHFVRQP